MKTIVIMAIGLGTALIWLAQQRRNQRSRSATKKLALLAAKGTINFDEISETFDTLVIKENYAEEGFSKRLNSEGFLQTLAIDKDKYALQSLLRNGDRFLLIGEVKIKDLLPTHNGNKEIDKYYPTNLLISFNSPEKEISFHSPFPDDNEHYYLLKDLAFAIHQSIAQ